jgi:hypothetical protein
MQPSPFQQQGSGPKLTSAEAAALRRVTPQKDGRLKSVVISRCRFVDRPTMQAAASSREGHDDEASTRVVGGRPAGSRAVRPWPTASRATHPSDHRTDRLHPGERLLGARRHPLDDAADRARAVPDDPDDELRVTRDLLSFGAPRLRRSAPGATTLPHREASHTSSGARTSRRQSRTRRFAAAECGSACAKRAAPARSASTGASAPGGGFRRARSGGTTVG